MNIVLIGPVYPYKGGIAHYTSLLYKELAKNHSTRLISYKMQYPKILFKKEQRDYSNDTFKVDSAEFLINTANIFNILKVGKNIRKSKPDMVIIQWWHPYFAPCYRILEGAIGKKIKIVFICHNVFPHERFPADRFLTKIALKRGDGYIVHSKKDENDLALIKENPNCRFNPHPTYNAFKMRNISKEQGRQEIIDRDGFDINQDTQLLLFFGFVREYKGLKYLLKAMPMIKAKLPNCRLMVVGSFGEDKQDYLTLIEQLEIYDVVFLKDDYTPDNEIEKYFAATDLVVLPYIDATQSGIVQISFGFEKPVVVTNVGGLPDVVMDGISGYVIEPRSLSAIASVITDFFSFDRKTLFLEGVRSQARRFDWSRIADKIGELIEQ